MRRAKARGVTIWSDRLAERERAAAAVHARNHVNGIAHVVGDRYVGIEVVATRWEPVLRGQPCSPDERRIVIATEHAFDARALGRLYLTQRGVEPSVVESVVVRRWTPRESFPFTVRLLSRAPDGSLVVEAPDVTS